MAGALIPAIGLVGKALSAVSFMGTLMPDKQDEGPSIRIKAANPGDDNAEGGVVRNSPRALYCPTLTDLF